MFLNCGLRQMRRVAGTSHAADRPSKRTTRHDAQQPDAGMQRGVAPPPRSSTRWTARTAAFLAKALFAYVRRIGLGNVSELDPVVAPIGESGTVVPHRLASRRAWCHQRLRRCRATPMAALVRRSMASSKMPWRRGVLSGLGEREHGSSFILSDLNGRWMTLWRTLRGLRVGVATGARTESGQKSRQTCTAARANVTSADGHDIERLSSINIYRCRQS